MIIGTETPVEEEPTIPTDLAAPDDLSSIIEQATEEETIEEETTEEYLENVDQETPGVPELEAPPPPVVSNIPPSTPILSTLRVKEPAQIMVHNAHYHYRIESINACVSTCETLIK